MGILTFNAILSLAALRFRLFDSKLSPATALAATVLGAVGVVAYLSVFHYLGTSVALLVFGTTTVTLILLASARLVIGTIMARRDQLVRLATLGRFSAQMAHDLKNPLAALKGAAQFLHEEQKQGRSLTDQAEFLEIIVDQADRLERLISTYQRLGRLEPELGRAVDDPGARPRGAANVRLVGGHRERRARRRSPGLRGRSRSPRARAREPDEERLRGHARRRRRSP